MDFQEYINKTIEAIKKSSFILRNSVVPNFNNTPLTNEEIQKLWSNDIAKEYPRYENLKSFMLFVNKKDTSVNEFLAFNDNTYFYVKYIQYPESPQEYYIVTTKHGDFIRGFTTKEKAEEYINNELDHCCKFFQTRRQHSYFADEWDIKKINITDNTEPVCEPNKSKKNKPDSYYNQQHRYCSRTVNDQSCKKCQVKLDLDYDYYTASDSDEEIRQERIKKMEQM